MELINELLESTFTYRIIKKYKSRIKILSKITLTLLFLGLILSYLFFILSKPFITVILLVTTFLFGWISIKTQIYERIRIVKADDNLSILINRKNKINMCAFNLMMKNEIFSKIKNSEGKISIILIDYLITELKETIEVHVKRYLAFGVILSFLIGPLFNLYFEKIPSTNSLELNIIIHLFVVIVLVSFSFIILSFKNTFLEFTKDYHAKVAIMGQLRDIKVDVLLNSDLQA
ncbi:RsiW-degrading membrane proteinase PrsW (M82 family) [Pedobacter sp. AK013]|uniref:hypothetical protein n=1 Tax=Pedobacter sp. AK013 TaxID=2723071 RepID=UPI00162149D9|nr:hypothetical protein [Pedobacter sp. AK013]MBB6238445.1 RsiW-degrading membrane proteinase PrsW (M82 family) [Pedobacter sp. AK013]